MNFFLRKSQTNNGQKKFTTYEEFILTPEPIVCPILALALHIIYKTLQFSMEDAIFLKESHSKSYLKTFLMIS